MIKKKDLIHLAYYYGCSRKCHIMRWDSHVDKFYYIDNVGSRISIDSIEHWEDVIDTPYDGFLPIRLIDATSDYNSIKIYKKIWGKVPIIRKTLIRNAMMCPDGTIIESKHRHDYQVHKIGDDKYVVDGGLDYIKRSHPPTANIKEMCEWKSRKLWTFPKNVLYSDLIDNEMVKKYPLCQQFLKDIKS